jgi:hypothetical protein
MVIEGKVALGLPGTIGDTRRAKARIRVLKRRALDPILFVTNRNMERMQW